MKQTFLDVAQVEAADEAPPAVRVLTEEGEEVPKDKSESSQPVVLAREGPQTSWGEEMRAAGQEGEVERKEEQVGTREAKLEAVLMRLTDLQNRELVSLEAKHSSLDVRKNSPQD